MSHKIAHIALDFLPKPGMCGAERRDTRMIEITSKAYGVQVRERNPHFVRATYEARNVALTEDFGVRFGFDASRGNKLNTCCRLS